MLSPGQLGTFGNGRLTLYSFTLIPLTSFDLDELILLLKYFYTNIKLISKIINFKNRLYFTRIVVSYYNQMAMVLVNRVI